MLLYLSVFSHGTLVEGFVRRDRIAFLKLDRVEAEAVVRAKDVRIVSGSPFVTKT